MKKRIYVDMDNTLCDYYNHFLNWACLLYGKNILVKSKNEALKSKSSVDWFDGVSEREAFFIRHGVHGDIKFWECMPTLNHNTLEVFDWLDKNFEVFIATSAATNPEPSLTGKILWVRKNLPTFDVGRIFFIRFKKYLIGDYIIDDLPSVAEFQGKIVMMDYSYNQHIPSTHRVSNWTDIYNLFKKEK